MYLPVGGLSLLCTIAQATGECRLILDKNGAVEPTKLRDALLVRERVESCERRARLNDLREPLHVERALERIRKDVERHRAAHGVVQKLGRYP